MKFDKWQLDCLSTALGFGSGFSLILVAYKLLPLEWGLFISGTGLVFLGYVSQRPADIRPTTYDVEEVETRR